ncbi:MAG: hypothetical protein ABS81_00565 [Pseudonocardia sp. SCN 72-86]|nr:MAG: hypothetical protein ABS81_00565 [Pseudonocardia sp. SCN 72-86]
MEKGFFAEQGFNPSYITVSSGAAMVPALNAGQVDILSSSMSVVVGMRQGGQDVQAITGYTTGLNYFIYVRKGVDVPANGSFEDKMKALNGLKIGAQGGADGVVVPFMKAMIKAGGGDPAAINIPNLAYGGTQIAALQKGEVDAVLADDSTVATGDQLGLGTSVFSLLNDPPAQYKGLLTSSIVTSQTTLTKYPDFAERLHTAMGKVYAWMKDPANAEELRKIAVSAQGLPDSPDLPQRLATLASQMTLDADRTKLQKSMDFLYSSGQVKPQPAITVDQFFNKVMIGQS